MHIEFLDEPEPGGRPPDQEPVTAAGATGDSYGGSVQGGPCRARRIAASRTVRAGWALPLAALAATVALRSHGAGHSPPPTEPPVSTRPMPSAAAPPERGDAALAVVSNRLSDPQPDGDLTRPGGRPGGCRPVRARMSPETAAVRVVRRAYPQFMERDFGRVMDRSAGLCVAELRGSTGPLQLLVRIVSPDARTPVRLFDPVAFHSENHDGLLTSCVSFASDTGWDVLVGARGPARYPTTTELNAIASDPRLRW